MNRLYCLLLLFFTSFIQGYTQELAIKSKVESVKINSDSTFVKKVEVTFKTIDNPSVYPIFYDTKLEQISDIQLYVKRGRKFKTLKSIQIQEEELGLDYIASKSVKTIKLPTGEDIKLIYKIKCSELMYFSSLPLFSNYEIDTLVYKIQVPKTSFEFLHNTIYGDSLKFFAMDSLDLDGKIDYTIKLNPKKVEPDILSFIGIYRDQKNPLIRTIVVPKSYGGNGIAYLNDWYLNQVKTRRGLNDQAIRKIDELTDGVSDSEEIIRILYKYVQSQFKYVMIEIGMGAFIPSHVNEVFLNKEGDCKDLSNFLSEALTYKGIKSNLALAATYHHITDCDFPSLVSANHVVCVAYKNEKPIILDPTDPVHYLNSPVQSIQERSLMVLGPNGGKLLVADSFSNENNLINYDIYLKTNSDKMTLEGDFSVSYSGISGNFLKRELLYLKNDEAVTITKKHLESVFGNQSISNLHIKNNTDTIQAKGNLVVDGRIFNDSNTQILILDFLPSPVEMIDMDKALLSGTHLDTNYKKIVTMRIELDKPIKDFKTKIIDKKHEGVGLNLEITNVSDQLIECYYEFNIDSYAVDTENIEPIGNTLDLLNRTLDEPILLKNKN